MLLKKALFDEELVLEGLYGHPDRTAASRAQVQESRYEVATSNGDTVRAMCLISFSDDILEIKAESVPVKLHLHEIHLISVQENALWSGATIGAEIGALAGIIYGIVLGPVEEPREVSGSGSPVLFEIISAIIVRPIHYAIKPVLYGVGFGLIGGGNRGIDWFTSEHIANLSTV